MLFIIHKLVESTDWIANIIAPKMVLGWKRDHFYVRKVDRFILLKAEITEAVS